MYPVEYNTYNGSSVYLSRQYNGDDLSWDRHYKILDHLGNVRAVLREDAAAPEGYIIEGRYDYEPFGARTPATNPERQGFIGKEKDSESALADHGVRKYESSYGRFTSIDPLWEQYAGWTPYHYCRNNPVSRYDANGMLDEAHWVVDMYNNMNEDQQTSFNETSQKIGMVVVYLFLSQLGITPDDVNDNSTDTENNPVPTYDDSSIDANNDPSENVYDLTKPETWPEPPTDLPTEPGPPSRKKPRERGEKSLWDSEGGEYRPHNKDKYHNKTHWDFRPYGTNKKWEDIPMKREE